MGTLKTPLATLLTTLLTLSPLAANSPLYYLAAKGQVKEALAELSQDKTLKMGEIQTVAKAYLSYALGKELASDDTPKAMLCLMGAQIARDPSLIPDLTRYLESPNPQLVLSSIYTLASFGDDEATDAICMALNSPHLLLRLEACFQLARLSHPQALDHIEALMQKLDARFENFFPHFIALLGNKRAEEKLRKMLTTQAATVDTQQQALLAAAQNNKKHLVPVIQEQAKLSNPRIQSASLAALLVLESQDLQSKALFEKASKASHFETRLIANLGLALAFHEEKSLHWIQKEAEKEQALALCALALIGSFEKEKNIAILEKSLHSPSPVTRGQAAMSLLRLKEPSCLPVLKEMLLEDPRDLLFFPKSSEGGILETLRVVSAAHLKYEKRPEVLEFGLRYKEFILEKALSLGQESFLELAQAILDHPQPDLTPQLMLCLQNLGGPKTVAFLKTNSEKPGAPLIRLYSQLALYRLQEPGPWQEKLLSWANNVSSLPTFSLRPQTSLLPNENTPIANPYTLSAEEDSRLYLEVLEALASDRSEKSLRALLSTISKAPDSNLPALMGILIRALS